MSADEALRKNSTLADIAPDEWFPNRSGTLWVACYRVLRAQVGDFVPPIEIDLGRVRAHFVQGDVTYLDSSDFRIVPVTHDEWRLEGQPTEKNTGEQSLVLLIAPHRVGEEEGNEARTRAAISAAVGLIIAVCGRNAAWITHTLALA